MKFTEEDVPLMKLIFNPSTHDMGMLVGGERANQIFNHVFFSIGYDVSYFSTNPLIFYAIILSKRGLCDFFWNNNILNLSILTQYDINFMLRNSPISKKIWDSGKLNLSLLYKDELEYFKQKFNY